MNISQCDAFSSGRRKAFAWRRHGATAGVLLRALPFSALRASFLLRLLHARWYSINLPLPAPGASPSHGGIIYDEEGKSVSCFARAFSCFLSMAANMADVGVGAALVATCDIRPVVVVNGRPRLRWPLPMALYSLFMWSLCRRVVRPVSIAARRVFACDIFSFL